MRVRRETVLESNPYRAELAHSRPVGAALGGYFRKSGMSISSSPISSELRWRSSS
jgi:hypothetical protein